MPKFESPIGNKQIAGAPMREFTVSDETGYTQPPAQIRSRDHQMPVLDEAAMRDFNARMHPQGQPMREMSDFEKEVLAVKKAKREGKERLSEGAKRRIEMLVGMTRLSRTLEIDGQSYKLQTLTSQELREALVGAAEFDGTVQFIFETRKQLLARALTVVAGVEIDQFLYSNDIEDRLYFIEQMDHALLLRLYNEYVTLAQEAQEKYAIKTEAQVKEVMEDLKKP